MAMLARDSNRWYDTCTCIYTHRWCGYMSGFTVIQYDTNSEEVGHDAHLRCSHLILVCNYAATRSKELHL